jgi:hypothetical protein
VKNKCNTPLEKDKAQATFLSDKEIYHKLIDKEISGLIFIASFA